MAGNPVQHNDAVRRKLFRDEAIRFLGSRQFGGVLEARLGSLRKWTVPMVLAMLLTLVAIGTLRISHTIRCAGWLVPANGLAKVASARAGFVMERKVVEGQVVAAGEALFVMANEPATRAGEISYSGVVALLLEKRRALDSEILMARQQSGEQGRARNQRSDLLMRETAALDRQIALQQQRAHLAQAGYARFARLEALQFIAPALVQEKLAEVLQVQQSLSELERQRMVQDRELEEVRAEGRSAQLQLARTVAAMQHNISLLDQELAMELGQREWVVTAPRDGVVSGIRVHAGQTASAEQVLAMVLPAHAALEAEVYVPAGMAAFLIPGMPATLHFDAVPAHLAGAVPATITEVTAVAGNMNDLATLGVPTPEVAASPSVHRVRMALDSQFLSHGNRSLIVQSGMVLHASIPLQSARLFERLIPPGMSMVIQ